MQKKLDEAIKLYDLAGVHPAANIPPFMSDDEYLELVEDVKAKGFLHPVRVTSDKLLIDGRNRLCASIEVGLDVAIETFDPSDPLGYVISENKRRNFTTGQKAAMGLAIKEYYAEEAKKRQSEAGKERILSKDEKTGKFLKTDKSLLLDNCPEAGGDRKSVEYRNSIKVGKSVRDNCPSPINNKQERNKEILSRDQAGKTAGVSGKSISRAELVKTQSPEIFEEVRSGKKSLNAAVEEVKEKEKTKTPSKFNETTDSVSWSKYTWNPVTGCKYNCHYCYARDIGNRFSGHFNPEFHEDRLVAPENTKCKDGWPNNVFVCSMSDLFGDWVPKEWITKVLDVVSKNQQWYFLFLTKNPSRYIEFKDLFGDNCLLGATADTQKRFDNAIDAFTKLKYEGVTFVSMEPMEEEIDMVNANLDVFQWLIVGGRSKTTGAEAKQPEWEWVEKVLLQAREKSIAVYFKPNLTVRPEETPFDEL